MRLFSLSVFLHCLLLKSSLASQWGTGPADGAELFVCAGGEVTLDWALNTTPGDQVHDIEWTYNGGSQELIAISSHGNFITLPAFSGRVEKLPGVSGGTGIKLTNLTVADTGNYTIEVSGMAAHGEFYALFKHIYINVRDGLLTDDGSLQVSQSVESTSSGVTVTLLCGHFLYPGQPTYDVEWTTPDGTMMTSSDYKNGSFLFHLPTPVEGGTYTCRVPAGADPCLATSQEATIMVDAATIRLALLEAKVHKLESENTILHQQTQVNYAGLDTRIKHLESSELGFVQSTIQQQALLQAELVNVTDQVHVLEADNQKIQADLAGASANLSQRIDTLDATTQVQQQRVGVVQQQVVTIQSQITREFGAIATLQVSDVNRGHQITSLNASVNTLLDLSKEAVSFHAWQLASSDLDLGDPLVVSTVVNNQGNGYDGNTGVFRAPVDGTYMFMATAGALDQSSPDFHLSVDGGDGVAFAISNINTNITTATLHAALTLTSGQTVTLVSDNSAKYYDSATMFTGVLISPKMP